MGIMICFTRKHILMTFNKSVLLIMTSRKLLKLTLSKMRIN